MRSTYKMYGLLALGLGVFLSVCLVLYFSLRPSPALSEINWLPQWLASWADRNGNLRTIVPYLGASLLVSLCVSLYEQIFPSISVSVGIRRFICLATGASSLFILLLLTELAQIGLSRRWASWEDVFWGGLGIFLGILLWLSVEWFYQFYNRRRGRALLKQSSV